MISIVIQYMKRFRLITIALPVDMEIDKVKNRQVKKTLATFAFSGLFHDDLSFEVTLFADHIFYGIVFHVDLAGFWNAGKVSFI